MVLQLNFRVKKRCHNRTTRNIEARNAKPFDVTINFIIQYCVQNKKAEQQMNSFNLHFHYNFLCPMTFLCMNEIFTELEIKLENVN